ncbi:hypothetical protein INR49_023174 [Caranx melampygus]|nr:hypothetical protein INR49_023174 [Caranx melampygus]
MEQRWSSNGCLRLMFHQISDTGGANDSDRDKERMERIYTFSPLKAVPPWVQFSPFVGEPRLTWLGQTVRPGAELARSR